MISPVLSFKELLQSMVTPVERNSFGFLVVFAKKSTTWPPSVSMTEIVWPFLMSILIPEQALTVYYIFISLINYCLSLKLL